MGAALFAALLAVGLGLAPGASAKGDKGGNGGTQGASHSNPDGGGVDKPYPADGQDARSQGDSDWDGNNGCGNDDDREDDNNGWCGRKPKHEHEDAERSAVRSSSVDKHDEDKKDVVVVHVHVTEAKVTLVEAKRALMKARMMGADLATLQALRAEVMAAKAALAAAETTDVTETADTTDTGAVKAASFDSRAPLESAAVAGELSAASAGTTTAAAPAAKVLGASIQRGASAPAAADTAVLGTTQSRGMVGALALTGFEMVTLALGALLLIAVGLVTRRYGMQNQS